MMTRAEHVQWCKRRALEYLDVMTPPDPVQAVTSMLSDLGKHPETRGLSDTMGPIGLFSMRDSAEARSFILGFAE